MREVKAASERARIARAAGLVSGLTLVSRLLGLVREMVFAALLGASLHADAFRIGSGKNQGEIQLEFVWLA